MHTESSLPIWSTPLFADHGSAIAMTRGTLGGSLENVSPTTTSASTNAGNTDGAVGSTTSPGSSSSNN